MTPGNDELAIVNVSAAEYGKETVSVGHEIAVEQHETLGIFEKWIQECRVWYGRGGVFMYDSLLWRTFLLVSSKLVYTTRRRVKSTYLGVVTGYSRMLSIFDYDLLCSGSLDIDWHTYLPTSKYCKLETETTKMYLAEVFRPSLIESFVEIFLWTIVTYYDHSLLRTRYRQQMGASR